MPTPKELIWKKYYEAVKNGRQKEAEGYLKQLHQAPSAPKTGGCSRCRKRF